MQQDDAWDEYLRTSDIMSGAVARHPSERTPLVIPPRPPVWNRGIGWLVAMPLLWVAVNMVLGIVGGLWWWILITTFLMAVAASVILAREDQRMLRAAGLDDAPAPWRVLFPLAYLVPRARTLWPLNSAGYQPLWAHVGVLLVLVVLYFAVPLLLGIAMRLEETKALIGA
ncbi:MAG: hypothetical protein IR160_03885 [Salinibacterium sp.]|nr:hypothetical protein [Salinibacterium sp.]MBF0671707.1 hypothetical protein [Salinibacterium sp.]